VRLVADAQLPPALAQWVCIEFKTENLAMRFEQYLKSGPRHASAMAHLAEP